MLGRYIGLEPVVVAVDKTPSLGRRWIHIPSSLDKFLFGTRGVYGTYAAGYVVISHTHVSSNACPSLRLV